MIRYRCNTCKTQVHSSICPTCGNRTEVKSKIYWCDQCKVPIYEENCEVCDTKGTYLGTDVRPVFPEERLLIEVILGKPFAYVKDSVWNGSGNHYFVNGKKLNFSVQHLKDVDDKKIKELYESLKIKNTYEYFDQYIEQWILCNKTRYQDIVSEAIDYIKDQCKDVKLTDMFVSFSGGKDSTVTSDLVMRALNNPKVLHIFGDTTLEFPETMDYIERFKKEHRQTLVVSSRNKEKDFYELMKVIGPPSRVMRWCCTVFKTGAIGRKIESLFRSKHHIVTFYGIRRSESASRNKYDRESQSPKITKQTVISPIIDWFDYDVWLYLLTTKIDFNRAYRLGYTRVGCWCCPNNSGWSEFLSKIHMSEQFYHFREELVAFAKKIGKPDPEEYIDSGNWKARQGGNGLKQAQKSVVSFEECVLEENTFNYQLQRPITEELYELFKPFGQLNFNLGNKRLGEVYVINQKGEVCLIIKGRIGTNELKVTINKINILGSKSLKSAEEKVKCQLTKYQMCIGCKACNSVCKHNAIKIKELGQQQVYYTIDDQRCVRCGECVNHYIGGCYMRKVLTIKRGDSNGNKKVPTKRA